MGHFEWALVIVMLLALVADLGLGSALVQFREADDRHYSAGFWAALIAGAAITGVVWVSAPWMALVLAPGDPETFARVLSTLVLLIPFAAVSGIFRARLQRELDFRRISLAEGASSALHFIVVVALLNGGFALMSPVLGAVVREAALLAGLVWAAGWHPRPRLEIGSLRQILAFGLNLTGSRCLGYLNSNLARVFIYPLLGEAAMGYFSFAYRLTLTPLTRISTVITRVFFPTFSAMQTDDALLRRFYLRTVQVVGLVYWPTVVGLLVFAPEIVGLAGEEVSPALEPVRILAAATLIKAVGMAVGSVFLAKGRASWALYWSLFSLAVLVPLLYWATEYGVSGMAGVIAATSVLFLVLSQHLANRLIGLTFGEYLRVLVRPTLVSGVTFAVMWNLHPMMPSDPASALLLGGGVGTLVVLVALRLFAWSACRALWRNVIGEVSS